MGSLWWIKVWTAALLQSSWRLNIPLMLLEAKVDSSHFFLVNEHSPRERHYLGLLVGDLASEIFWSAGIMNMKPSNLFLTRVNTLTLITHFASRSVVAVCSCDSQGYRKSLCKDETSKNRLWSRRDGVRFRQNAKKIFSPAVIFF